MKKNKSIVKGIVDLVFILIIFFIDTSYAMEKTTISTGRKLSPGKENRSFTSSPPQSSSAFQSLRSSKRHLKKLSRTE